ncbi:MAG TPA: GntR family transcriptional regulator [Gordonia polyisoprenivorans]|uniref:GntR family transcriptional regulator n=1 Tax=Gordonia polyisoprenivorans TaxID=84595 RepID=UPI000374B330|nr:GntR family transcriptional regulator [Gordonia polyisoprenivorans]HCS58839.1 GntR family transcriptional regulator [Gordonia polyisoprenivorans]
MNRRRPNLLVAKLVEVRSHHEHANIEEELRRLILSGGAPPGTVIPPGEVADAFRVSPIPVREALKTLVGEGLVVHQRNSGYRVSSLSTDELKEIYFVRGILEQAALAQAVDRASEADIAAARGCHEQLVSATKWGDGKSFHDVSRQFHMCLTAPCAMPRLLSMFESTWNLTEPFQIMRSVSSATQELLNDDHAALLDGFTARDVSAVLDVANTHHTRLETAILETAGRLGLPPE